MNQFKSKSSSACVCLWIHLLLSIVCGTKVRNLSNDELKRILSYVPAVARSVSTHWKDNVEAISQHDIHSLTTKLCDNADLSNETALNYSTQIRTIMETNHHNFAFRKRFGAALPSILTHINSKHLSPQNTRSLLDALNIDLSQITQMLQTFIRYFHRQSFGFYGCQIRDSSLMIAALYLDQRHFISDPFDTGNIILGLLYHAALYKTFMQFYPFGNATNTILWNSITIQSIPSQIIKQFNGSGPYDTPELFAYLRAGTYPDIMESLFWTEFVLVLMDVDEGPHGIKFRSNRDFVPSRQRQVKMIIDIMSYYHDNDAETFDRLCSSLATIFFHPEVIIDIALIDGMDPQFTSVVFDKLCSLRTDWKRMSMGGMSTSELSSDRYHNYHCSFLGGIFIQFFGFCGLILTLLVIVHAFAGFMSVGYVVTITVAWFIPQILGIFDKDLKLNFAHNVKQAIIDVCPGRPVLAVVFISVVLFVLWSFLFYYPLFLVPF
eukprot:695780_1